MSTFNIFWEQNFWTSLIVLSLICVLISFFIFKVTRLIASRHGNKSNRIRLMLILGSGGHTAELLSIVCKLDLQLKFDATFVIGHDDQLSENKLKTSHLHYSQIVQVQRARRVGQSYASSVWTTTITMFQSLLLCYQIRPQLLICNGPATCIPFCLAAKLLGARTVFIESFCRTRSLSLSGKIACRICDHVLVQWPDLISLHPKINYIGLLV